MKKKLLIVFMVLLFAFAPLTACSGLGGSKLSKKQDTNYVVHSNGGNAVQYGNFVYFINGYSGYENTDGKSNVWGNVVKGALYRVELLGEKVTGGREFDLKADTVTGLGFATSYYVIDANEDELYLTEAQYGELAGGGQLEIETLLDSEDEERAAEIVTEYFHLEDILYNVDGVELIAPKVIGTSGYADGGLFIFDNYIYYASPHDQKNKQGEVQTKKTSFFRTRIDGTKTKTELIYTTKNDSEKLPYGFYKKNDFVFLTAQDGDTIVSVKMNDKKVVSKDIIADEVTSAYFPRQTTYDSSNTNFNKVEDYVYFVSKVDTTSGIIRTGTAIEVMRPDGTQRFEFLKNGQTSSIEAVRDGLLFYRTVSDDSGKTIIAYTNLFDAFAVHSGTEGNAAGLVAGVALNDVLSDYTSTYCFRPDPLGNAVYVLAFTSNAVYGINNTTATRTKILNSACNFAGIYGNKMYYENQSNAYYHINLYTAHEDNTPVLIEETATAQGLRADFVAGHFMFFGTVDTYANAYAKFYPLDERDGSNISLFIGERTEADTKPTDEE